MPTLNQKTIVWVAIVLLLILGVYFYTSKSAVAPAPTGTETATTSDETVTGATGTKTPTTPKSDGLSGYSNSEYGFTLRFPPYINPHNSFSTFHNLTNNWRVNASQVNQGKGIVEFPVYSVDQGSVATGKSYPLFFIAELRVGVSPNVKECYSYDPGYTNQKVTDVNINGVTFKRFSFQDAAMMQYVQGESYRTIHNNMCYVLEQIKAGSNYRDDTMKPGVAETTLTNYYNTAGTITKTFKFTK